MKRYINKDDVVAEMERLISNGQVELQKSQENNDGENYIVWAEHIATCIKVLSLLDTLEVKDVDFETEWKKYFEHKGNLATVNVKDLAKHFFELGMQKGE